MISEWRENRLINKNFSKITLSAQLYPKLRDALDYVISREGKRIRPVIVVISTKLCGGNETHVMNLALAIECLHTASLIHDDIIDQGILRRDGKTVPYMFDIPIAILAGDWFISKAVELISIYPNRIITNLAHLGMNMVNGEAIDSHSYEDRISDDDYLNCVSLKTAEIFSFSAASPSILFSRDDDYTSHLYSYGRNLGIMYQIIDDTFEFLGKLDEKKSFKKSRTLPQILNEKYDEEEAWYKLTHIIKSYSIACKESLKYFGNCEETEKLSKIVDYFGIQQLLNLDRFSNFDVEL